MEHIESLQMVLKDLIIDTVLPNPTELLSIYGRVNEFFHSFSVNKSPI